MTRKGIDQLKRHEGLRLQAYLCPAGKLTIGYGHTGNVKEDDVITLEEAERLLYEDIAGAEWDVKRLIVNYDIISPNRQDALVNMAFNLGGAGLGKFKTFLRAVQAQEWQAAAAALVNSKWYSQVKNRSRDIIKLILEG